MALRSRALTVVSAARMLRSISACTAAMAWISPATLPQDQAPASI